jgi:hypothetical protein
LRKEHKCQVSENIVPRKIAGPSKMEISSLGYFILRNLVIHMGDCEIREAAVEGVSG